MTCLYSLHLVQVSHCLLKSLCVPLESCFQVFCPDCLTSCCVAGRAAPVGSGAGSAAVVSPLMRRWRFWAFSSSDSIMAVSTHPDNPHTTHKQCSHFTNNPEQFIIHLICLLSHHNSQAQIETDWVWIHSVTEQISRQSQRYHLSKAHCWWWMVCSGHVWKGILASRLLNTSQYEQHILQYTTLYTGLGLVIC